MSHVIDLEQRKQLWRATLDENGPLRAAKVAQLGVFVLGDVGSSVDLYHNHDEEFQRTFLLLDNAGMLAALLEPYAALEAPDENERLFPEDFIAIIAARVARIRREGGDDAEQAGTLFRFWRRGLYERQERDADTLTVAETAALFGITPQAVYKWIRSGRIEGQKGPDGKTRIRTSDLNTTREQERAIDEVRATLREEKRGAVTTIAADDLAALTDAGVDEQ